MLLSRLLDVIDIMVVVPREVTVVLESATLGDASGDLVSAVVEAVEYGGELNEILENDVEIVDNVEGVDDAEGIGGLFDNVL